MLTLFKKILILVVLLNMAVFNLSCASYMVYKDSANKVAMRKALNSNNEEAVKALKLGIDISSTGITVTWAEAIAERPWLQLGAAGIDALLAWGSYEGIKAIDGAKEPDVIIIQGDNNNIHLNGESITKDDIEIDNT